MGAHIDSLRLYQHQIDSLKKITNQPNNLLHIKWLEPSVQAAAIIATTTIITVIVGFIFKDYLIPRWLEKRTKRIEGQELFIFYKTNLFRAALSLNYRLHEIYHTRSHYLWKNAPVNTFYDYKYKSSVYRLCVLLAWIRAYRLSEAKLKINNKDESLHRISSCLQNVESTFADGQRVEMSMTQKFCDIIKVDKEHIDPDIIKKLSIEIDHLITKYLKETINESIAELGESQKITFITDLNEILSKLSIDKQINTEQHSDVIKALSVKLALIYRDWQQGIGDLMLEKEGDNYTVKSFQKFEQIWDKPAEDSEKKWLKRMEVIFTHLDLRADHQADSRIEQLKLIYTNIYQLLKTLYFIEVGPRPISENNFNELSVTIN